MEIPHTGRNTNLCVCVGLAQWCEKPLSLLKTKIAEILGHYGNSRTDVGLRLSAFL